MEMDMEFVDQMIRRNFGEGEKITFYELIRRLPPIDKKFAALILDIPNNTKADSFSILKVNTDDEHSVTIDLGPNSYADECWFELVVYFNTNGIDTLFIRQDAMY